MAQMKGAYRLGKAIVEGIEALHGQLDKEEGGEHFAQTPANHTKVRAALLESVRGAGFIGLFFFLASMLPAETPAETP